MSVAAGLLSPVPPVEAPVSVGAPVSAVVVVVLPVGELVVPVVDPLVDPVVEPVDPVVEPVVDPVVLGGVPVSAVSAVFACALLPSRAQTIRTGMARGIPPRIGR